MHTCVQSGGQARVMDARGIRSEPFDLVVAADGARSSLRENSGIPHSCREYEHGALWAVGRSSTIRGRLHQVTHGTRRLCGVLPMGEERCSVFWGMRRDEFDSLQKEGNWAEWRKGVARLAPVAAEVLTRIKNTDELFFTTFRQTRMERWSDGRLVFIGDAACDESASGARC